MFTGIIQEIGTVSRIRRTAGLVRLTLHAPKTAAQVAPLESVAVNGVCLTVTGRRREALECDVIRETQRVTSLARLRAGSRVNLEPSLRMSDRLNGHLVLGHVDGLGRITARRIRPGQLTLCVQVAPALRAPLVAKGSIAVDGVSLTVGALQGRAGFTLHLIPETLCLTTLAERAVGDRVNIEVDYMAKLIRGALRAR